METIRQLSERVNNEESGKGKAENFPFPLSPESAPVQRALVAERGKSQGKFSTSVKIKQVVEYHHMYADKTQFEVAKHFNITVRTLRNYLRKAGVTWKQVGE